MSETNATQTAKSPEKAALDKTAAKKSAETMIETAPPNWKGVDIKKSLPPRFSWRGVSYVTASLTDAQVKKLAEDSGFKHIMTK